MTPGLLVALVIGIHDGDTLTILQDNQPVKIRLAEVDAPESQQPFGTRARQSLAAMCFNTWAEIHFTGKRHFKRKLAHVTCNGQDVGTAQLHAGFAWVDPRYSTDPALPPIEAQARAVKQGLWADPNPIPPWEWRRMPRY
jgi:micrococcal nuclease